ncbi:hypothetical protein [uncultured Fibrobacter sp.]|uniref:hypothetical protein n=1 Tax=uncultured Fibrobacter sp. TaxID=261512 RepID=UPI0025D610DF|nr:hypothetical protein [uncultured Fibrobacter sp.]
MADGMEMAKVEGVRATKEALLVTRIRKLAPVIAENATLSPDQKDEYKTAMDEVNQKLAELESMQAKLNEKSVELANTKISLEAELIDAKNQTEAFKAKYEECKSAEQQLNMLLDQVDSSYSSEDISKFLNQMINDFNESTNSDSEYAKYVINSMDVDLKVRIYDESKYDKQKILSVKNGETANGNSGKDDVGNGNVGEKKFRFVAPKINETSEDSLSSIKITIQAVPK